MKMSRAERVFHHGARCPPLQSGLPPASSLEDIDACCTPPSYFSSS